MTITLYNNTSPSNFVNKSITVVSTLTGTLRNPTSVTDPVITIERSDPTGFNYARVEEFGRYYFITGISSESNALISISLHVDVLMTYKEGIRNMYAIIRRQENKYNLYLDDGIFKGYQNTKHKVIQFPYGFTEYSYILALAGNGDS